MNFIDINTRGTRRFLFHSMCIAIVAFWLILVGFLVKKVHFKETPDAADSIQLSGKIDSFLVGTHGARVHHVCARLFEKNGYKLIVNEQDTQEQPDGILYAKLI